MGISNFPSSKVDVPTALGLLDWSWYRFSRSSETLTEAVALKLLVELERVPSAGAVFLRAAVDPADFEATWRPAVLALKTLAAQYSWGSKQKRAGLKQIAEAPRLLAATQAAASCDEVPLELLGVLAIDASEASADALMPHFLQATAPGGRLERFSILRTYLKDTAWTRQLLAAVEEKSATRRQESPLSRVAVSLGIDGAPPFQVNLTIDGAARGKGRPARVDLRLKAGREPVVWVKANADLVRSTNRAVECGVDQLPAMFAREARKLDVRWKFSRGPGDLPARQAPHALPGLACGRVTRCPNLANSAKNP